MTNLYATVHYNGDVDQAKKLTENAIRNISFSDAFVFDYDYIKRRLDVYNK